MEKTSTSRVKIAMHAQNLFPRHKRVLNDFNKATSVLCGKSLNGKVLVLGRNR
ncbi:hypothetical protein PsAD2_00064 [Pseudovibrio axinellae]|uniref:Uncharacterized protein n=1 Tax=Pseudovibrio axinellae TaxID=989403 RepID=A0A166B994_9HYPH|nr:hypothetical protein PsAD2_00064 [Pseudovibrio axinellae]SEQ57605.1 hypothetical protein SAMN05421798_103136 [Pseudovibrio axinellae]